MNNSSSVTMFQMLQNKSDTEIVNMIQSSFSLACTLCIFYRVFDFSSYFKSVKTKREASRKAAQKKEYERLKTLFIAMRDNDQDIESLRLSSDEEEKKQEDNGVLKIAHKKKKKLKVERMEEEV
jgi:hypothetical protein